MADPIWGTSTPGAFGDLPPGPDRTLAFLERLYGPMTARSREGLMPETDSLAAYEPTLGDEAANALPDMGAFSDRVEPVARFLGDNATVPAEVATFLATQPVRTGEAIGELAIDPSWENAGNAAAQTALTFVPPAKLLKSVPAAAAIGAGYGILGSDAYAASKKKPDEPAIPAPDEDGLISGLAPDQYKELQDLKKRISQGRWSSGAERRTIESRVNDLNTASTRAQEAKQASRRAIEATKAANEEAARAKAAAEEAQRAQDLKDANTPLKEKYPALGYAIPAITGALAFGSGALLRGRGISQTKKGLESVTARLEEELAKRKGHVSRGNIPAAMESQEVMKRLAKEQDDLNKSANALFGPGTAPALMAGGTFGVAGKVLPDEIDAQRALPGSPLEESVKSRWDSWPEAATNIGIGAVSGLTAAEGGSVLRKSLSGAPYHRSFLPEIEAFDGRAKDLAAKAAAKKIAGPKKSVVEWAEKQTRPALPPPTPAPKAAVEAKTKSRGENAKLDRSFNPKSGRWHEANGDFAPGKPPK